MGPVILAEGEGPEVVPGERNSGTPGENSQTLLAWVGRTGRAGRRGIEWGVSWGKALMDWMKFVENVRYIMGVLLVISLPPAMAYWFIVHPFVGFWRRLGAKWTFVLLGVFLVGAMSALFPFRDRLLARDLGTSLPAILAGLPLLVVSGMISRQRKRYLSFRTLAGVPEVAPDGSGPGLLQEGIYGRIRHPRYVEFALGCLGWALVCNYVGLYISVGLTILALFAIVLVEERELRQRFGQAYVDYSARVPRFIPRLRS